MATNARTVAELITCTSTTDAPDALVAHTKWTICKRCVQTATLKPQPGGVRVARVTSNLGEPDEGKLSCPVR